MRPTGFFVLQGNGTSTANGVPPFDHASVIRTIVECFNISDGTANLTQRDLKAPSLADALSLDSSDMNNGPPNVELPNVDAPAPGSRNSHPADIYKAMLERPLRGRFC